MTNNYYAENYKKGSDGEKLNEDNLKEMNATGKCNSCKHFRFGGLKCAKHTDYAPITYTEFTNKGKFINVLKPSSCKDYESRTKKPETAKEEAAAE